MIMIYNLKFVQTVFFISSKFNSIYERHNDVIKFYGTIIEVVGYLKKL